MRTRAHAHTRGLTPRPALLRGFAAPRQLAATHFSPLMLPSRLGGFTPGWRLTARLPKVIPKCRKVAKSLEVKKSFLIFAADLKTKAYETTRSYDETQRAFNGNRQTRVCPGAQNLETSAGLNTKASRREIRLQPLHNNASGERKRNYLGNGLSSFCKTF